MIELTDEQLAWERVKHEDWDEYVNTGGKI